MYVLILKCVTYGNGSISVFYPASFSTNKWTCHVDQCTSFMFDVTINDLISWVSYFRLILRMTFLIFTSQVLGINTIIKGVINTPIHVRKLLVCTQKSHVISLTSPTPNLDGHRQHNNVAYMNNAFDQVYD